MHHEDIGSAQGEQAVAQLLQELLKAAPEVLAFSQFTEYQIPWFRSVLVELLSGCAEVKIIFPEQVRSMGERLFPEGGRVLASFRVVELPTSWLVVGDAVVYVGTVPEVWVQVVKTPTLVKAYKEYFWRQWNYGEAPTLVETTLRYFSYSSSIDVYNSPSYDEDITAVIQLIEREEDGWVLDEKTGKKEQLKYWSVPKTTADFLRLFSLATGRKAILEIGTSAGYSTLHFTQALLRTGGHITTIERLPKKVALAQAHFQQAKAERCISIREGAGLEVVPTLTGQYDLIFLDADREKYEVYLELLLPRLLPRGFLLVDNVFDYGHQMRGYLERVQNDPRFQTMIVPVDNGLAITRLR